MKNINTNVLYGIIGLLGGIIIGSCFASYGMHRRFDKGMDYKKGSSMMQHRMPDGTMMDDETMSMESMMHSMNSSLEGKTGDDFDKAFLKEMIVHHKGAVSMAEMVLKTSKKAELTKLANDIISAQNKEITMMENWQTTWFK